jgi:Ca2+-binding EF-hand superfamily protein
VDAVQLCNNNNGDSSNIERKIVGGCPLPAAAVHVAVSSDHRMLAVACCDGSLHCFDIVHVNSNETNNISLDLRWTHENAHSHTQPILFSSQMATGAAAADAGPVRSFEFAPSSDTSSSHHLLLLVDCKAGTMHVYNAAGTRQNGAELICASLHSTSSVLGCHVSCASWYPNFMHDPNSYLIAVGSSTNGSVHLVQCSLASSALSDGSHQIPRLSHLSRLSPPTSELAELQQDVDDHITPWSCTHLHWFQAHNLAVGYARTLPLPDGNEVDDDNDDDDPREHQVTFFVAQFPSSSSSNITFNHAQWQGFPYVAPFFSVVMGGRHVFLTTYIPVLASSDNTNGSTCIGMLMVGSNLSNDVSVISQSASIKNTFTLLDLADGEGISTPTDDDDEFTFPIGLATASATTNGLGKSVALLSNTSGGLEVLQMTHYNVTGFGSIVFDVENTENGYYPAPYTSAVPAVVMNNSALHESSGQTKVLATEPTLEDEKEFVFIQKGNGDAPSEETNADHPPAASIGSTGSSFGPASTIPTPVVNTAAAPAPADTKPTFGFGAASLNALSAPAFGTGSATPVFGAPAATTFCAIAKAEADDTPVFGSPAKGFGFANASSTTFGSVAAGSLSSSAFGGGSAAPVFGSGVKPVFGSSTSTPSKAFGGSRSGEASILASSGSKSTFGTASSSAFGGTASGGGTSTFGSLASSQSGGGFGALALASIPDKDTSAAAASPFGVGSKSAFGSGSAPVFGFGAKQPFGASTVFPSFGSDSGGAPTLGSVESRGASGFGDAASTSQSSETEGSMPKPAFGGGGSAITFGNLAGKSSTSSSFGSGNTAPTFRSTSGHSSGVSFGTPAASFGSIFAAEEKQISNDCLDHPVSPQARSGFGEDASTDESSNDDNDSKGSTSDDSHVALPIGTGDGSNVFSFGGLTVCSPEKTAGASPSPGFSIAPPTLGFAPATSAPGPPKSPRPETSTSSASSTPLPAENSEETTEELRSTGKKAAAVFDRIDSQKTGKIPIDQFEDLLEELGEGFFGDELQDQVDQVDTEHSGTITKRAFIDWYIYLVEGPGNGEDEDASSDDSDRREEMENATAAFKGIAGGEQYIQVERFKDLMENMGTTYCEEEHCRTIKKISKDGKITLKAFTTWYIDWLFGGDESESEVDSEGGAAAGASGTHESKFTSGWGNIFFTEAGSWKCPACMVPSKADAFQCAACETKRPGQERKSTDGWGNRFATEAGTWKCPACMVSNKVDASQCAACETKRPGQESANVKAEPVAIPSVSTPTAAGARIGTSGFTFCTAASTGLTAVASGTGIGAGGFAFGAAATSGLTFGSSPREEFTTVSSIVPAAGGFMFGRATPSSSTPQAPAEESASYAPAAESGGFKFTSSSSIADKDQATPSDSKHGHKEAFPVSSFGKTAGDVFDGLDSEMTGILPTSQFEDLLEGLGEGFFGDELQKQIDKVDTGKTGVITRAFFVDWYINLVEGPVEDQEDASSDDSDRREELEKANAVFQGIAGGEASIRSDQFKDLMEGMGTTYCEEEHRRTIKKLSEDGNISLKAFTTWYIDWLFGDGSEFDSEEEGGGGGGGTATPSYAGSKGGWGSMFAAKAGSWKCSACMISNNADASKCAACETERPGLDNSANTASAAAKEASPASAPTSVGASASIGLGGFTFGMAGTSGLKFGSPSESPKAPVPDSGTGACIGADGFTFGTAGTSGLRTFRSSGQSGISPSAAIVSTALGGFSFSAKAASPLASPVKKKDSPRVAVSRTSSSRDPKSSGFNFQKASDGASEGGGTITPILSRFEKAASDVFQSFDSEETGAVPIASFEELLEGLGEGFYGEELQKQIDKVDPNNVGVIKKAAFVNWYVCLVEGPGLAGAEDDTSSEDSDRREEFEKATEAFKSIAGDEPSIPSKQFKGLMENMGTTYCEEEHRRTIRKISEDDKITLKAFTTWYIDWLFGDESESEIDSEGEESEANAPEQGECQSEGWGVMFAPDAGSWKCPVCMVTNKEGLSKCAACETDRPGPDKDSKKNASTSKKYISDSSAAGAGAIIGADGFTFESGGATGLSYGQGEAVRPGKKSTKDASTSKNDVSIPTAAGAGASIGAGGFTFGSGGATGLSFGSSGQIDNPSGAASGDSTSKGFSFGGASEVSKQEHQVNQTPKKETTGPVSAFPPMSSKAPTPFGCVSTGTAPSSAFSFPPMASKPPTPFSSFKEKPAAEKKESSSSSDFPPMASKAPTPFSAFGVKTSTTAQSPFAPASSTSAFPPMATKAPTPVSFSLTKPAEKKQGPSSSAFPPMASKAPTSFGAVDAKISTTSQSASVPASSTSAFPPMATKAPTPFRFSKEKPAEKKKSSSFSAFPPMASKAPTPFCAVGAKSSTTSQSSFAPVNSAFPPMASKAPTPFSFSNEKPADKKKSLSCSAFPPMASKAPTPFSAVGAESEKKTPALSSITTKPPTPFSFPVASTEKKETPVSSGFPPMALKAPTPFSAPGTKSSESSAFPPMASKAPTPSCFSNEKPNVEKKQSSSSSAFPPMAFKAPTPFSSTGAKTTSGSEKSGSSSFFPPVSSVAPTPFQGASSAAPAASPVSSFPPMPLKAPSPFSAFGSEKKQGSLFGGTTEISSGFSFASTSKTTPFGESLAPTLSSTAAFPPMSAKAPQPFGGGTSKTTPFGALLAQAPSSTSAFPPTSAKAPQPFGGGTSKTTPFDGSLAPAPSSTSAFPPMSNKAPQPFGGGLTTKTVEEKKASATSTAFSPMAVKAPTPFSSFGKTESNSVASKATRSRAGSSSAFPPMSITAPTPFGPAATKAASSSSNKAPATASGFPPMSATAPKPFSVQSSERGQSSDREHTLSSAARQTSSSTMTRLARLPGSAPPSACETQVWDIVGKIQTSLSTLEDKRVKIIQSKENENFVNAISSKADLARAIKMTLNETSKAIAEQKGAAVLRMSSCDDLKRQIEESQKLLLEGGPESKSGKCYAHQPLDSESEKERTRLASQVAKTHTMLTAMSHRANLMRFLVQEGGNNTRQVPISKQKRKELFLLSKSTYDRATANEALVDKLDAELNNARNMNMAKGNDKKVEEKVITTSTRQRRGRGRRNQRTITPSKKSLGMENPSADASKRTAWIETLSLSVSTAKTQIGVSLVSQKFAKPRRFTGSSRILQQPAQQRNNHRPWSNAQSQLMKTGSSSTGNPGRVSLYSPTPKSRFSKSSVPEAAGRQHARSSDWGGAMNLQIRRKEVSMASVGAEGLSGLGTSPQRIAENRKAIARGMPVMPSETKEKPVARAKPAAALPTSSTLPSFSSVGKSDLTAIGALKLPLKEFEIAEGVKSELFSALSKGSGPTKLQFGSLGDDVPKPKTQTTETKSENDAAATASTIGFGGLSSFGASLGASLNLVESPIATKKSTLSMAPISKGLSAGEAIPESKPVSSEPPAKTDYGSILVEFYQKHNPTKMGDIDSTLKKYQVGSREIFLTVSGPFLPSDHFLLSFIFCFLLAGKRS